MLRQDRQNQRRITAFENCKRMHASLEQELKSNLDAKAAFERGAASLPMPSAQFEKHLESLRHALVRKEQEINSLAIKLGYVKASAVHFIGGPSGYGMEQYLDDMRGQAR